MSVAAYVEKVHNLYTEEKFSDIWNEIVTQIDAHPRQTRRDYYNALLQGCVVEETTGDNQIMKDEIQNYMLLSLIFNLKIVTFWM